MDIPFPAVLFAALSLKSKGKNQKAKIKRQKSKGKNQKAKIKRQKFYLYLYPKLLFGKQ
jgi:hypothetical protein